MRSDEIVRLRVGCIRWQHEDVVVPETGELLPRDAVCFPDIPVNKTLAAYTIAVHPLVGKRIFGVKPGDDEQAIYVADEESAREEQGHVPQTFEVWRQWHLSDTTLLFVAWDGSEAAGLVRGETMGEQGWIWHLGVRTRWRRRGLGMSLFRYIQREFARRGSRTMKLNVDMFNSTGAFRLYECSGDAPVLTHEKLYQKRLLRH